MRLQWIGYGLAILACFTTPELRAHASADESPNSPAENQDLAATADQDTVYLVSGKQISGTVLVNSAAFVVLEVHPGVPLRLPAGQVARVDFAERSNQNPDSNGFEEDGSGANVVSGVRMSEKLGRALSAIVPINPADTQDLQDVLQVLEYLGREMHVDVKVDPQVREIAAEKLSWTGPIAEGQTLYEIVQEDLAVRYQGIIRIELADEQIKILHADPNS